LNEEASKPVSLQPTFSLEALNKLVEKLETKIDSLESKLEQHSIDQNIYSKHPTSL
jgi:hypothetical protein